MTEKRFNFVGGYLYDGNKPIGHVEDIKFRQDFEDIVNNLHKENQELKKELQRIYDVATVNKVKDIVDAIYDDLLYETTEESDHKRKIILECLEKIDNFGDDLNDWKETFCLLPFQ